MNRSLFVVLFVAATLAAAPWARAQNVAESAQLRAAILRGIRDDAPPAPLLFIYDIDKESGVGQQVSAIANIPARGRSASERVLVPGGDTVAVRVTVDALGEATAVATIDLWGTVRRPSAKGPTSWFVRRRADLVRQRGAWVLQKLTTVMES